MLIGITGKARAGKDTFALQLMARGYAKYSFASPIKAACNLIFGWDERHSEGELKEVVDPVFGVSPRYAYQTLGTDWGRKLINDEIWIKVAKKFLARHALVVIPDVRFDNEAQFIYDNNGIIIEIIRPDQQGIALSSHASESGIDSKYKAKSIQIVNNQDINTLRAKADDLIDSFSRMQKGITT